MNRFWMVCVVMCALAVALIGCATRHAAETNSATRDQPQVALEAELQKIINSGEAANAEVERWIAESEHKDDPQEDAEAAKKLREKIEQRFATARKGYEEFIRRHPKFGAGYAAYGDF